ncbi:MAG: hypothetical protein ACREQI_00835 [Candidatus Binataceae bacterium]
MAFAGEAASADTWAGLFRDLLRLPFRRFVIDTELSEAEIVQRLGAILGKQNYFSRAFTSTDKLFAGIVTPQGFKIRRIIKYNNPSLPVILGSFEPGPKGARVEITMRLSRFVAALDSLWFTGVTVFFVLAMFSKSPANLVPFLLFTLGMLIIGYIICIVPFGAEARKARRLLDEALQSKPGPSVQNALERAP